MRAKFAYADFTFPLLPHIKALQLIAMLGFKGVDIGLFEGRSHLQPSNQFDQLKRKARQLRRKAGDLGLEVADIFLQMDTDFVRHAINHPQAGRRRKVREGFLQALEYACEAGCKHLSILPGARFEGEAHSLSLGRAVDELAWRVERARAHGLVLGVEAHVGSLVPKPGPAADLIRRVPGLTLSLDYTHFARQGIADEEVEPLIQYASNFHVRGARKGRLQDTFERNTIDYARIYQVMRQTEYKGWIEIEYVWMDWERCNECDTLAETIRFFEFFRSLGRSSS